MSLTANRISLYTRSCVSKTQIFVSSHSLGTNSTFSLNPTTPHKNPAKPLTTQTRGPHPPLAPLKLSPHHPVYPSPLAPTSGSLLADFGWLKALKPAHAFAEGAEGEIIPEALAGHDRALETWPRVLLWQGLFGV